MRTVQLRFGFSVLGRHFFSAPSPQSPACVSFFPHPCFLAHELAQLQCHLMSFSMCVSQSFVA